MPNVQTITLSRTQYAYLYEEAAGGLAGWAQQSARDALDLQDPDATVYLDRFCPDVEKMGIGKKLLWAAGGIFALYLAFKLLTR